jgi:hypothetical protein
MTPFYHSMVFIAAALAICLLLLLGLQTGAGGPGTQSSILFYVKEAQRAEALGRLEQRTRESWTAMHAIIHKLIDGELKLGEALDAYSELYEQLYYVRSWRAEGKVKPLSRQEAFEQVLGCIQDQLKGDPARAREVRQRVHEEWHSLCAHPTAGPQGAAFTPAPDRGLLLGKLPVSALASGR